MNSQLHFLAVAAVLFQIDSMRGQLIDMKIVEEPSSYGINHLGSQVRSESLQLRVRPANVTGPMHLVRLKGRCYSEIFDNYKYALCPFDNMTQHEQRNQWNPYNGVLGVWQEWEIKDNKFVAMIMGDGDSCGELYRSARVLFECGNQSKIVNVSEPQTCNYQLTLQTPLVCHPDSMLVYPTLSQELQKRWDHLEEEMFQGIWTQKGYDKRLNEIFEKAGLHLSRKYHNELKQQAEEIKQEKFRQGEFSTLDQCKEAYKDLQERVKTLESELQDLKDIRGNTTENAAS